MCVCYLVGHLFVLSCSLCAGIKGLLTMHNSRSLMMQVSSSNANIYPVVYITIVSHYTEYSSHSQEVLGRFKKIFFSRFGKVTKMLQIKNDGKGSSNEC